MLFLLLSVFFFRTIVSTQDASANKGTQPRPTKSPARAPLPVPSFVQTADPDTPNSNSTRRTETLKLSAAPPQSPLARAVLAGRIPASTIPKSMRTEAL